MKYKDFIKKREDIDQLNTFYEVYSLMPYKIFIWLHPER